MKYCTLLSHSLLSNYEYIFEADSDRDAVNYYIQEFGEKPSRLEVYDETLGCYILAFEVVEVETEWGIEERDWFPRLAEEQ